MLRTIHYQMRKGYAPRGHSVLNEIKHNLAHLVVKQLGMDYESLVYLDSGSYARVYSCGDHVIKITTDVEDAKLSLRAKEFEFESIVNTKDVLKTKIKNTAGDDQWMFAIVNEYVEQDWDRSIIVDFVEYYDNDIGTYYATLRESMPIEEEELRLNIIKDLVEPFLECAYTDIDVEVTFLVSGLVNLFQECWKLGVLRLDSHVGNLISDSDGNLKLIDIGHYSSNHKNLSKIKDILNVEA